MIETSNKAKPGSSLKRLIILAVVVVGGLAAGRPPVFLWDCIIPEFFCHFGPCFAIFPEFLLAYGCVRNVLHPNLESVYLMHAVIKPFVWRLLMENLH